MLCNVTEMFYMTGVMLTTSNDLFSAIADV